MRTKEVVIIGAGKIGRGFLSDCFSNAGYHLVFVNGSPRTIDKLNEAKKYTIFTSSPEGVTSRVITGFEAYSSQRDFDMVVKRLSEIDLACVALYPTAYDNVADQLVGAIRKRMADGVEEPLNVLFFVNMVLVSDIMRKKILERLSNDDEIKYFETHVGLVEALTQRGGYDPTPEMLEQDPLAISTTPGDVLPVGDNFVGEKPTDIPSMQFLDRIQGRLIRKVWCGNMSHCTQAVIGRYKGYTYIYECVRDQYIRKVVDYAIAEANFGVGEEYGFTQEEMFQHIYKKPWKDKLDDTAKDFVTRVAADPMRKLARGDRYIGPALLCIKHGKMPFFLARGAAYLFLYKNDEDKSCVEKDKIIAELGIEKAIEKICQLDLSNANDKIIYDLILNNYREILDHEVYPDQMA